MSEANKAVVRRAIEQVWNRGNWSVVDELVASDYLGHSASAASASQSETQGETHGRAGYQQFHAALRRGFPDIHFTVEDQVAQGDKVVTRWTARATHTGEFHSIPPTGKHGAITGITIERIANGKVVECWTNADDLGLMRLLGVLPQPAQVDG